MKYLKGIKIGFAMCGSFCTFSKAFQQAEILKSLGADLVPIMSFNASTISTRFGSASEQIAKLTEICEKVPITSIEDAEPIGPQNLTDIMLVCPCTGNTLSKLANSITDTPVTMAVKSHLRNGKPVVIALATNDALSGSAKNIGALLNYNNYYFVPFSQDSPYNKPFSAIADFSLIPESVMQVLELRETFRDRE
ncbi:MAG: dipicolinate synthase subunit B [Oscillospiraceae bacterium]